VPAGLPARSGARAGTGRGGPSREGREEISEASLPLFRTFFAAAERHGIGGFEEALSGGRR